jgi:hypothetical protein
MGNTLVANQLSPELLAQLFSQESEDPFLILVTLSHSSFVTPIRLVNNTEPIISRTNTFNTFPMKITLPVDDGETARGVTIEFDNVGLELISALRSVVNTQIEVTLEMVLASMPDIVQMSVEELKIAGIRYDRQRISAELIVDNFLSTGMTSERYTPQNFPGLF